MSEMTTEQTKALEVYFEAANTGYKDIDETLTVDGCIKIKQITKQNIANFLWCAVKKPSDSNTQTLLSKFFTEHKNEIQKHKKTIDSKIKEYIPQLNIKNTDYDVDQIINHYTKWNYSTRVDSQLGGALPLLIGLPVAIIVVCVYCASVYYSNSSGGKRRRTQKARKSKRKSRNYRRKSQRRRR